MHEFFFSPEKQTIFVHVNNFKKYILGLLATLFFSAPSFAEKTDFYKTATDAIGGTYKKELLAIDQLKTQYGYIYNSTTKTYYKN